MLSFLIDAVPVCTCNNVAEIRQVFTSLLRDRRVKYISFINPEIFLRQKKDENLHEYFKHSEYNFIDGIGLLYAINAKLKTSFDISNRYTGTDFFDYLPEEEIKVFLFGSQPGYAEVAKKNIELKYKNISIVGVLDGYTSKSDSEIVNTINSTTPDILIVCTGCPKQELWIQNNIQQLKVPLVFGNGGAIDFWSGTVKRAPKFIITLGLEWLFRLFQDFTVRRIKRQIKLLKFFYIYKTRQYSIVETSLVSKNRSDDHK